MLDPILLVGIGSLAALVAATVRSARRQGHTIGRWSWAAILTGLALVAVAVLSPVATVASGYLLSAHLVQITLLMGFAPWLLLSGLPRSGGAGVPRSLVRLGRLVSHPGVAIVMVNAVLIGWHVPAVFDACLRHPTLYAIQLVTLFGASVAFWWPIVVPAPAGREGLSPLVKLGYILLATIPQTFAGLLLALAHAPFYAAYAEAPRLFGVSAATDQQVAGACMAILSKLALFAAFSVVMWRLLDAHGVDDDAADDNGGNGGQDDDDAPRPVTPPAPAWLGLLERSRLIDEPSAPASGREVVAAGR